MNYNLPDVFVDPATRKVLQDIGQRIVDLEPGVGGATNIQPLTAMPDDFVLITEGDSRTSIGGSGLTAGEEWPAQLVAMSSCAGRVTLHNPAQGGSLIAGLVSRYAASVFPLRPSITGKYTILIIWVGNDTASDISAATADAALASYVATARADGFSEVWICTDIHRASFTVAQYAQWIEFNRLCRWRVGTTYDRCIDLAKAFQNINDTSLSGDALHPNATGMKAIARYINAQMQLAAPVNNQDGAVLTDAVKARSGVFDDSLSIGHGGSGAPLMLGSATAFGQMVIQATAGQANDVAGFSAYARASGANSDARNFFVGWNASSLGMFDIVQSTTSTGAPSVSRLSIDRDGACSITGNLSVGGAFSGGAGTVTLAAAATTFVATKNLMTVTGDAGGNTIATITGGRAGQELTLLFVDANVTLTDTAAATADTINLSAAFTSSANDTITLMHNGTKWFEKSRSVN